MKTPKWHVLEATPRDDYTILLTFADGAKKVYDARPLLNIPISAPLQDLNLFLKGHVEYGTVVWTEDIDIAPEELYYNGKPID